MTVPFMRAYTELLVKTCHRRGAHAMGGMAAFVPSRRDPEVNETALAKVREDKEREAGQGFDGTWVAHPDLVPVALEVFGRILGERPNQLERQRPDVTRSAAALLDVSSTPGEITPEGLHNNVSVGIQYLAAWLQGSGAVAIFNLMEDAATSEISRSQVWQWLRHGRVERADVEQAIDEEVGKLEQERRPARHAVAQGQDDLLLPGRPGEVALAGRLSDPRVGQRVHAVEQVLRPVLARCRGAAETGRIAADVGLGEQERAHLTARTARQEFRLLLLGAEHL